MSKKRNELNKRLLTKAEKQMLLDNYKKSKE